VANGPGKRSVIWVQGCSIGCHGCFNPSTHTGGSPHDLFSVNELVNWVVDQSVDGATISGGEPFQQLEGVMEFSRSLKSRGLSVIVLTGYTAPQVQAMASELDLREFFDVVVAGPYRSSMHLASSLRGSSNKEFLFYSDVYSRKDFDSVPEAEVLVEPDGTIVVTGINVPNLR